MLARSRLGQAFLVVASAAALYILAALLTGWREISAQLAAYPARLLAPLIGLSLVNYGLRYGRWEMFLRRLDIRLPWSQSLAVFVATFALAITPGKVGEVFKAGYLWERRGVPLSRGLAIVVAERAFDLLAIVLLAAGGLLYWTGPVAGIRVALLVGALAPLLVLALRAQGVQQWLLARCARAPWLRGRVPALAEGIASLRRLTTPLTGTSSLLLSVCAWLAECASLWLVCEGLDSAISPGQALFVYAAATLAGSLIFLPGGLGGTEGTIVFLLLALRLSMETAISAALIVRLSTLWLAVCLGLLAFLLARRRFLAAPGAGAPLNDWTR